MHLNASVRGFFESGFRAAERAGRKSPGGSGTRFLVAGRRQRLFPPVLKASGALTE